MIGARLGTAWSCHHSSANSWSVSGRRRAHGDRRRGRGGGSPPRTMRRRPCGRRCEHGSADLHASELASLCRACKECVRCSRCRQERTKPCGVRQAAVRDRRGRCREVGHDGARLEPGVDVVGGIRSVGGHGAAETSRELRCPPWAVLLRWSLSWRQSGLRGLPTQEARLPRRSGSVSRRLTAGVLPPIEMVRLPWGTRLVPVDEVERLLADGRQPAAPVVVRPRGRPGREPGLPDEVVARIQRERASGKGLAEIARGLNIDEVGTAQGGRQWWASTVRSVLVRAGQ